MSQRLDEFKEFVRRHPLIKQDVYAKKKTWQQLYEDFVILGEDGFSEYKGNEVEAKEEPKEKKPSQTEDMIKTVVGYVKKIDPDQVTKTVTSIQKVLELLGALGGGTASTALAKKSTGDPLFDKRFDEWY